MTKTEIIEAFKTNFQDHINVNAEVLSSLGQTTYGYEAQVIGVLRPIHTSMVQDAVRLAQQVGAKLAPISRGKNWGWGSCATHVDNVILVDLSAMNSIIDYSDELGYITIQPGVSVNDVVNFLDQQNATRVLPMGGTTAQASLVGHMCERGISVGTLYHDRASHACGLEAVLGDGNIVHTGMRRYQRSAVSATHRWGPGPSLESLLTQSDMAIITEATIWLPTGSAHTFVIAAASNDLEGLVNTFRDCESQGLRIASQIYNRAKVEKLFFGKSQPLGLTLPPGDWIAIAPIYPASAGHAQADRTFLFDKLKQVEHCVSMELPLIGSLGPFNGRPYENDDVLQGMLYRWGEKQDGEYVDPQRDKCGIIWGCYAAPMQGADITQACLIIDKVISEHGFDVYQAIHTVSERACLIFPQLSFPYKRGAEAAEALKALSKQLHAAGFPPYRVPVGLEGVPRANDAHDDVIDSIRRTLDPSGVFALGKYTPKTSPYKS